MNDGDSLPDWNDMIKQSEEVGYPELADQHGRMLARLTRACNTSTTESPVVHNTDNGARDANEVGLLSMCFVFPDMGTRCHLGHVRMGTVGVLALQQYAAAMDHC